MKIVVHIFLTGILLAVVIQGQGAGGGSDSRNNQFDNRKQSNQWDHREPSKHYNKDHKEPCTNNNCGSKSNNTILIVICILVVLPLCCCIFFCTLCYQRICKRTSAPGDAKFTSVPTSPGATLEEGPASPGTTTLVKVPTPPITKFTRVPLVEVTENNVNIFQSGVWSTHFFQYEEWHGPNQLLLSFDPRTFTVAGHGSDGVGAFTVTGKYSTETNEIELIKTYQSGTGDANENLGHTVTIEVTWNPEEHNFSGKWYVDTDMFPSEDEFVLKFETPLASRTDEKNIYP